MLSIKELQKIGEGQEAEIFICGTNKVLKLFKNESYTAKSCHEFEIMQNLNMIGMWSPEVYEKIVIDEKPGYTMKYIEGSCLLSLFLQKPKSLQETASFFAFQQTKINAVLAPENFESEKESLIWGINNSGLPAKVIEYGLQLLAFLPEGNILCHGDYNLSNIIVNKDKSTVIIDWGGASRGYFLSDVANAVLMIKNSGLLEKKHGLFRSDILVREMFTKYYLETYRKIKYFSDRELRDWEIIRAMARLAYCVESEKVRLEKFIIFNYNNRHRKNSRVRLF